MTEEQARQILGVEVGASEEQIKRAWAGEIRNHPPDSDPENNQLINRAKAILLGKEKADYGAPTEARGGSASGSGDNGATKESSASGGDDSSCWGCGCGSLALIALCLAFPPITVPVVIVAIIIIKQMFSK